MKAIVYEKSTGLTLREVEKPIPRDHEVLIRIYASSVNALDHRLMQMGIGLPKSRILGADIVGRVEAVGIAVKSFNLGDVVLGDISDRGLGGFAEFVAVSETVLILKPSSVSADIAAAVPVAAVTALQALRDTGAVKSGMKVLINGAGGGVGMYAVQLASYFGAEVTAVCSARNATMVKNLGANTVIDYALEDVTASGRRFDRIIAINGYHPFSAYKRILTKNGIFVMVGGPLRQILQILFLGSLMSIGSKKFRSFTSKPNVKDLAFIMNLVANTTITPSIDRSYPLEQTAQALRYTADGHVQGKVIITI